MTLPDPPQGTSTHIGDSVGIRFREIMSGFVGTGTLDYDAGEVAGKARGERFSFDLEIQIPSLNAFLKAPLHKAEIPSGSINWGSHVASASTQKGGLTLFRDDPGNPGQKLFDFTFAFPDAAGHAIEVDAHKFLFDDKRFDAMSDLSTVFLRLSQGGTGIAAGITRVHFGEFITQLQSLHVTGTDDDDERHTATSAFFVFMNTELHEIYPSFPLIFQ